MSFTEYYDAEVGDKKKMLKPYTDRAPEYLIWQYDGEETLSKELWEKIQEYEYKFRIITRQLSSDGRVAKVSRELELFSPTGKHVLTLYDGEYLVFVEYSPEPFVTKTISKTSSLDAFTEIE